MKITRGNGIPLPFGVGGHQIQAPPTPERPTPPSTGSVPGSASATPAGPLGPRGGLDAGNGAARAALRALALDGKRDPQRAKGQTGAATAASLGARLMGLVRSDIGKRALVVAGLGVALLGAVPHAGAQALASQGGSTAHVQQSGQSGQELGQPVSKPGLSPQAALIEAKANAKQATSSAAVPAHKPTLQLLAAHAHAPNSAEIVFTVPDEMREVKDGQSVLVPLEGGRELHMIELRYQDTRPLQDFEFNRRLPGGEWETFRGDEYWAMEQKEKAGEVEIKREPDHNSMWINNPIRVRVDVVNAQGEVIHTVGKKFLDPQLHDASSVDGPGSAEVDNISNGYENLPAGKLPDGAQLRLTPVHDHKKAWEANRDLAMELSWVKPIYMPTHSERVSVREGDWEKPRAEGYPIDAGRPLAAVLVKWTDHGGTSSGSVRLTLPDGTTFATPSSNVGSGETELIPLDGAVSKDGKLFVEGWGIDVGNIEVLYQ